MSISDFIKLIEYLGMLSGIIGVWLTTKEKIWSWPVSIFSVSLYVIIFFYHKIYADSLLQIFYIFLSIYGWYLWKYPKKNEKKLPVITLDLKTIAVSFVIFVTLSIAIAYYLTHFTDSQIPVADAISTSASLVCTWLMAKKYLENWLIWILIDIFYVGIYFYRELYPTSFLYLIFTILAWRGFVDWKKTYNLQQNA